jgi:hypothetical protein
MLVQITLVMTVLVTVVEVGGLLIILLVMIIIIAISGKLMQLLVLLVAKIVRLLLIVYLRCAARVNTRPHNIEFVEFVFF